jgi:hypothetical protein
MIEVFKNQDKLDITLFISVYNEEKRVEYFLKSFIWIKNIFIIDKGSSDKTIEICKKYNVNIISIPYSEPYDSTFINKIVNDHCKTNWIIFSTASDIIHPKLSFELINLFNSEILLDTYDIIKVPFQTYVLGINHKNSPWYTEKKAYIFRRETYLINTEGVHNGIQFKYKNIYELECDYPVYHLTHETVDSMMNRHMSYWNGEAILPKEINLRKSFNLTVRKFLKIIFKNRIYLIGWDGIMLAFTYVSYFMLSFVYQWEKNKSNASFRYKKIREDIINEIEN